jgi:hypothetical protein
MLYDDNIEYAKKRLCNTLVRLKDGSPFFVIKILSDESKEKTCVGYVAGNFVQTCSTNDLDLTPVPLGFVNFVSDCSYAKRRPMRRDWKQGLSMNSLVLEPFKGFEVFTTL